MKSVNKGLPITRKAIMAPRERLRRFLANSTAIDFLRKQLHNFPILQEMVGLASYSFRKRAFIDTGKPISVDFKYNHATTANNKHQLLIDVSGVELRDVHTGVQRVTRSLLKELLDNPPGGFVVEPVYTDASGHIRYARRFLCAINQETHESEDSIVVVYPGDIFYCPDLYFPCPFSALSDLQRQGLHICFTIYDLIPFKYPDLFSKAFYNPFNDWFSGVLAIADSVVCDSRAVADEVVAWLDGHPYICDRALPIGFFHLGADIEASKPTSGVVNEGEEILVACEKRPTMLMVGTVEARKGHAQVLAAMDLLWRAEVDINLIIIGREGGWRTQKLTRQLRRHPERNQRLFWLESASDALLLKLYASVSALVAASFAEGFGLPLIEAARQGLPILARDIPVFREVAGDYAFYFQGEYPEDLSEAIHQWLVLYTKGCAPSSIGLPWLTWAQSSRQLQDLIVGNKWYQIWMPETKEM